MQLNKGRRRFIVSDSVYYQFCEGIPVASPPHCSRLSLSSQSVGYSSTLMLSLYLDTIQYHHFNFIKTKEFQNQVIMVDIEAQFQV